LSLKTQHRLRENFYNLRIFSNIFPFPQKIKFLPGEKFNYLLHAGVSNGEGRKAIAGTWQPCKGDV
jgi:hypothetical protein